MGTPDNVINLSTLYMKIYFLGMPFFMLYNYGAAILRAVGDTKRPLLFLIVAGVINACLNLLLVIAFHLGVAGVAIATVTAQFVSCVLVLRCLYKSDSSYQLRFSKLMIKSIFRTDLSGWNSGRNSEYCDQFLKCTSAVIGQFFRIRGDGRIYGSE